MVCDTKLEPPIMVLSTKRGFSPKYSTTDNGHMAEELLAVARPSISAMRSPASATALWLASARISISVRPFASPQPAWPTPTIATAPRNCLSEIIGRVLFSSSVAQGRCRSVRYRPEPAYQCRVHQASHLLPGTCNAPLLQGRPERRYSRRRLRACGARCY